MALVLLSDIDLLSARLRRVSAQCTESGLPRIIKIPSRHEGEKDDHEELDEYFKIPNELATRASELHELGAAAGSVQQSLYLAQQLVVLFGRVTDCHRWGTSADEFEPYALALLATARNETLRAGRDLRALFGVIEIGVHVPFRQRFLNGVKSIHLRMLGRR